MSGSVLGCDIGGTNIRAGLVDEEGTVTRFTKRSSTELLGCGRSPDIFTGFLSELLDETVQAVVLGIPGTLNRDRSEILSCPNLPSLGGREPAERLSAALGVPVFLERDVNLLLLHDMRELGADGLVIGLYIGTGLGNAIAVDGELFNGRDGVAGELGHITLPGRKEACTCGNTGCLENYASGRALEKLAAGQFPGTPVREVFTRHGGSPALLDYIDTLGSAVSIEVNILNPDRVILGGGVLDMPDFPKNALTEAIRNHARKPLPAENVELKYAKGTVYAGVLGASLLGWKKLRKRRMES